MIKGGYQIIDLENKPLTIDVGMVYEGIYELVENTRKATLISGLNISGTEYNDVFVYLRVVESNFEGIINDGIKIVINDNDVVKIVEF